MNYAVWLNRRGEETPVSKLSDAHLLNIIVDLKEGKLFPPVDVPEGNLDQGLERVAEKQALRREDWLHVMCGEALKRGLGHRSASRESSSEAAKRRQESLFGGITLPSICAMIRDKSLDWKPDFVRAVFAMLRDRLFSWRPSRSVDAERYDEAVRELVAATIEGAEGHVA